MGSRTIDTRTIAAAFIDEVETQLAGLDALSDGLLIEEPAVTNRHLNELDALYATIGVRFPDPQSTRAFADAVDAGLHEDVDAATTARHRAELAALPIFTSAASSAA